MARKFTRPHSIANTLLDEFKLEGEGVILPLFLFIISSEFIFLDDFPANEMLLNNLLQNFRGTRVVPNPFRIDESNGSLHADA